MSLEPCAKCGEENGAIAKLARQASIAHAKGRPTQRFLDEIAKLKESRTRCTSDGHVSSMSNSRVASAQRHERDRQKKASARE